MWRYGVYSLYTHTPYADNKWYSSLVPYFKTTTVHAHSLHLASIILSATSSLHTQWIIVPHLYALCNRPTVYVHVGRAPISSVETKPDFGQHVQNHNLTCWIHKNFSDVILCIRHRWELPCRSSGISSIFILIRRPPLMQYPWHGLNSTLHYNTWLFVVHNRPTLHLSYFVLKLH